MANTLLTKWQMTERASLQMHHLEHLVDQRTAQFKQASEALQREIDERKQLESQLVQSEKLASLGQMAAGVAHEINNPIGFISSNLGTLDGYFNQLLRVLDAWQTLGATPDRESVARLEQLRKDADLDFLLEDIPVLIRESKEGIGRVGQIVKDLKDFSRVDTHQQWQWANLQQGIESTLNIVASELKYKADLIKEYQPLPDIECLPSQINQVIMNLVVNAAQAMGPSAAPSPCAPGSSKTRPGWKSRTPAPGLRRTSCRKSSIRFSPPNRSARAPGWACRCPTALSKSTVATFRSAANRGWARPSASSCRCARAGPRPEAPQVAS